MKEHALFVYILCIQTVTKNLKCYYLEIYLKYLSCFAEDVMLIFFFFQLGVRIICPFILPLSFLFSEVLHIYIYKVDAVVYVVIISTEIIHNIVNLPEVKITWEKSKLKRQL